MTRLKVALICALFLCLGIAIGGKLFSQTQPRSFLSLNNCQDCLKPSELLGLAVAVGIQTFPGVLPSVVFESDKTIVFKHPSPQKRIHYLIVPKKDIKNIGELSREDMPYLDDAFLVARYLIEREGLSKYRLHTNGPGYQDVAYLHLHLIGE